MSKYALINVAPFETRLVIVDDGKIDEVFIERERTRSMVGNVYLGTVLRVLPAIGAVFIDIGRESSAFLSKNDIAPPDRPSAQDEVNDLSIITTLPLLGKSSSISVEHAKSSKSHPQRLPRVGERVVVQVIKDEYATKGARVTMNIALPGRYLVYLPTSPKLVGVSTLVAKKAQRIKLKAHLDMLFSQSSLMGGVIARSVCQPMMQDNEISNNLNECLQAELTYLGELWKSIEQSRVQASLTKVKFALLHQELPLPERVLRDVMTDDIEWIWVDNEAAYQKLLYASQKFMPSMTSRINYYDESTPLFGQSSQNIPDIEVQLQQALSSHCPLSSGGYLIIEHTQAMTTIDVNTGSFVGQGKTGSDVIFNTNKEAAIAIARELRLRNIGGIIIIDFIDMNAASHRQKVLDVFTEALKADSATTNITQVSDLGLVEMTRKRTRPSLSDELCEPCPTCGGIGRIKSMETVAFDILRALINKLANITFVKRSTVTIKVSQSMADHLKTHQDLSNLQKLTDAIIDIHIETSYHQGQYVIVMES